MAPYSIQVPLQWTCNRLGIGSSIFAGCIFHPPVLQGVAPFSSGAEWSWVPGQWIPSIVAMDPWQRHRHWQLPGTHFLRDRRTAGSHRRTWIEARRQIDCRQWAQQERIPRADGQMAAGTRRSRTNRIAGARFLRSSWPAHTVCFRCPRIGTGDCRHRRNRHKWLAHQYRIPQWLPWRASGDYVVLASHRQIHECSAIATAAIRYRHIEHSIRRFFGTTRFHRTKTILHREMGQTERIATGTHLLQSLRSATVSNARHFARKTLIGRRRNEYFRNWIDCMKYSDGNDPGARWTYVNECM